jgi:outer membrane protein OmpA-like peptidoglycan-associated protein
VEVFMDAHSRRSRWVSLVAGLTSVGLGCHTMHGEGPYPDPSRVAQGAIVGSMAGAAIGAGVDHRNRGRGALIGAVGGLLAGALLGHEWEHEHWHHHHPEADSYAHAAHPWWCDGAHTWEDDGDGAWHDDAYAHDGAGGYGDESYAAVDPIDAAPPDVLFEAGSAELTPAARAHLRRVVDRVREDPDVEVLLRGHSDGSGGEGFDLSDRRARSVRAFLAEQGVAPRRIAWVGLGDSQPIASGSSAEGQRRNRRVEIVLREREPDPYS